MTETNGDAAAPEARDGRILSFWQKFTYSFGQIGVNLAPGIVVGWVVYYYMGRTGADGTKIVLIGAGAIAAMNMLGRVVDALADPLVGFYSDKWKTRWGRRIPWVVLGAPLLAAFTMMVWFPPEQTAGWANTIWLGVAMSGLWFFYTVVVAPYLALLPEITPYRNERVVLSTYMSYMVVVGMLAGTIGAGLVFNGFSGGLDLGLFRLSDGYQVGGVLFGTITMLSFFISVMIVRERPADQIKPVAFKFTEAARECSRNPGFWPYILTVSFLRLGIDMLLMVIPFMVTILMGYGEDIAGIMQGVIVLGAAALFPLVAHLANKHGKKKIMLIGLIGFVPTLIGLTFVQHFPFVGYLIAGVGGLFGAEMGPGAVKLAHCLGMFAFALFPASAALVLPFPIYADIMDHDEKLTGYRREAMYNGMEGLITKFAAGVASALVPLMLQYLGNSPERPWGIISVAPVGGLLFLLGWQTFKKHPFDY